MNDPTQCSSILICYGTRPEVIKLASVMGELTERDVPFQTLFTGQHNELFEDVADLIPKPDIDLGIMEAEQSPADVFGRISSGIAPILRQKKPGLVIVQGDTTTAAAVALAAFYEEIPVGHVEAGLRTYDPKAPFPEEINRQVISRVAHLNWAPTETAAGNLRNEGVRNVSVTGNTVVDICSRFDLPISYGKKVLVTLHRRENFGNRMETMFRQLDKLAVEHGDLEFIFPMHPNPNVQKLKGILKHVNVIDPLGYAEMMKLLSRVKFAISDSGGIQEECAAFGKKVLVCRNTTERPEGIEAGFAKLVGTEVKSHFNWANDDSRWSGENPYGKGDAAQKIIDTLIVK